MSRLAFIGMLLALNACGTFSNNANRKIASEMVCGKVVEIEIIPRSRLVVTVLADERDKVEATSKLGGVVSPRMLTADIADIRTMAIASYKGGHYCSDGKKVNLVK